jgi:hypothetical protein
MPATSALRRPRRAPMSTTSMLIVGASYVFDWAVVIILGVTGYIMSRVTPNKRPFYLTDPNIS